MDWNKFATPTQISDADLAAAIAVRLAELRDATGVKAVLSEFIAPYATFVTIPQARRSEFLTALANVQPRSN